MTQKWFASQLAVFPEREVGVHESEFAGAAENGFDKRAQS